MLLILLLHAVTATAVGLLGRRLGRRALLLSAVAPAGAVAYLVARSGHVWDGGAVQERVGWASSLGLSLDLRLDGFGLLFWWLIAGIGLLVAFYAFAYFAERNDLGRFAAMLVAFAGAMLLLVAADNVLVMFVAWELTSITSYLLIGFRDDQATARSAALQALLVTGVGGLALMAGLVLLGQAAGSYSLTEILAAVPTSVPAQAGLALAFFGAFTKSAQIPFHFWLPGAMAAPTPVSAYLHSATMVKAGVYLVARLGPAFAGEVGWVVPLVVVVGGGSMLVGGWRALRVTDLKSLLALGTVSQLGFMILLLGIGDPELTHAGVALILAHALFKAALFMTVGVIDVQAGTRDLRRLHGVGSRLPVTAAATGLAAASMAGVFPLLGFISKEAALEGSLQADAPIVTALIVIGAVLTAAYGLRLLWGAFASKEDDQLTDDPVDPGTVQRPAFAFMTPPVVLVVLTVVFGAWVDPADVVVSAAAASLDPGSAGLHLALWHGIGAPLLLSLLALGLGYLVFRVPRAVARVAAVTERMPDTTAAYRRSLFGLNAVADRVTAVVQPGSLPVYGGVVLLTVLLLPGWVLARHARLPTGLDLAENPFQAAVAVLVVVAAVAAARVGRRLSAVLLLGGVGYGIAVLFVIQGAPDLALTQLLVETLTLAIFVVVLRQLPEHFDDIPWRLGRLVRLAVAGGTGLFVGGFALWAGTADRPEPPAAEYLTRALPEGGGRNVVNVILTDFRALDTLGEITVIMVAAIGVAALVRPALEPDSAVPAPEPANVPAADDRGDESGDGADVETGSAREPSGEEQR